MAFLEQVKDAAAPPGSQLANSEGGDGGVSVGRRLSKTTGGLGWTLGGKIRKVLPTGAAGTSPPSMEICNAGATTSPVEGGGSFVACAVDGGGVFDGPSRAALPVGRSALDESPGSP